MRHTYPLQLQKFVDLRLIQILNQKPTQVPFSLILKRIIWVFLSWACIFVFIQLIEHVIADTINVPIIWMILAGAGLPWWNSESLGTGCFRWPTTWLRIEMLDDCLDGWIFFPTPWTLWQPEKIC
jgi:hypothetical protein